jgi:hypothetical protein
MTRYWVSRNIVYFERSHKLENPTKQNSNSIKTQNRNRIEKEKTK